MSVDVDLGGISGGPIFRMIPEPEEGGFGVRFELVGIVYTGDGTYAPSHIIKAHNLKTLLPEGRFGRALRENRRT